MKDIPKIIYKYRNWFDPNHRKIIFSNELYLSSPKDFNDPFDCRIPSNLLLLDTVIKKRKYAEKIVRNNLEYFLLKGNDPNEHLRNFFRKLNTDIKSVQDENEMLHFMQQDLHYGVLSFSRYWSINLMWGHYANSHCGFCVGFHEEKLRTCGKFGRGGMVTYSNKFPDIDPLEDYSIERAIIETHTKEERWKYEKEYRITKLFKNAATLKDRIVKIQDNFYESITLGLKFPEDELPCILSLAESKKIPLYKLLKKHSSFQLYRVRIN